MGSEMCIRDRYSPAYESQSNGSSERLIQELWKVARTMLFESKLDMKLWGEEISHSNWLRNRLPSKRIDLKIPYTLWYDKRPDMSIHLKFSQPGYAFQYRPSTVKGKKFLPRTLFGHFVGMHSENSLYLIYHPSTNKLSLCRKADFTVFKYKVNLPPFSTLMDYISKQRQLEEIE